MYIIVRLYYSLFRVYAVLFNFSEYNIKSLVLYPWIKTVGRLIKVNEIYKIWIGSEDFEEEKQDKGSNWDLKFVLLLSLKEKKSQHMQKAKIIANKNIFKHLSSIPFFYFYWQCLNL